MPERAAIGAHETVGARLGAHPVHRLGDRVHRVVVARAPEERQAALTDLQTSAQKLTLDSLKKQLGMTDEEFGRWLKDQSMTMEALREEAKKDQQRLFVKVA